MRSAHLTPLRLALAGVRQKPARAFCLMLVVAALSFSLFGGTVLTGSLRNGLSNMSERLGADLMVVPEEYEAKLEGVLLKGEPSYFYFNRSAQDTVRALPGVEKVSSQFFLASLQKACCSSPVQLIGFDPATDFSVTPWIAKSYGGTLGDGQLIAGSDITLEDDGSLMFFGLRFPAVAKLDKTATGLDASVFMTMNTMNQLVTAARSTGMHFLSDTEPEGAISTVMVRLKSGADPNAISSEIQAAVPGVRVIAPKRLVSGVSGNLGALVGWVRSLSGAIWLFAFLLLAVVFSATANERKREFAVFRLLGATRGRLVGLVLTESALIGALGGVLGAALACLIVFPFSTYISDRLQLPYLAPGARAILEILALSLALSVLVGPLASVFAAFKISRAETYATMREGE